MCWSGGKGSWRPWRQIWSIYIVYMNAILKGKKKPVGMDMGRGNCSAWLVGLLIGTAIMENCMDILKEIKKTELCYL